MTHLIRTVALGLFINLCLLGLGTSQLLADDICVDDASDTGTEGAHCDTTCDGSGDCSLRDALEKANIDNPGASDTIFFDPDVFPVGTATTVTLTGDLQDITDDLIIAGPGASDLIIDQDGTNTGNARVLRTDASGITVAISDLTVTNGDGGVLVLATDDVTLDRVIVTGNTTTDSGVPHGAGVRNDGGTLTITNSTITNNTTGGTATGGGVQTRGGGTTSIDHSTIAGNEGEFGGGLRLAGDGSSLTVTNSTVFDNLSREDGGGVAQTGNTSMLDITNSTISGNQANSFGGGFNHVGTGTTLFTNVTIYQNVADEDDDAFGAGGGISQFDGAGTFEIEASIVAGNTDRSATAPDCFTDTVDGTDVESLGNNFIGNNLGCDDNTFNDPDVATKNDQVGDVIGSGDDADAIDPMLDVLAFNPPGPGDPANGTNTGTHAPLDGSPVIDAVDDTIGGPYPDQDQRGTTRPQGTADDIGAHEAVCGDGVTQSPEDCDDAGESATCNDDCSTATCGDSVVNAEAGETCDDGNTEDGDGCSGTCETETDGGGCSLLSQSSTSPMAPIAILFVGIMVLGLKRRFN